MALRRGLRVGIFPLLQRSWTVQGRQAISSAKADKLLRQIMQEELDTFPKTESEMPQLVKTEDWGAMTKLEQTGDRWILDMQKNSCLGLAWHPEVIKAIKNAMDRYGSGTGSSRAGHGTFDLHVEMEDYLTRFLGRDPENYRSMLMTSGYHANIGFFNRLVGREDVLITDSFIHPTFIDGMKFSSASRVTFRNNDMEDLEDKLRDNMDKKQRVICADGVYILGGYCANLNAMRALADDYDALIVIDDSNGVGVFGEKGKGTEEYMNAMNTADIITGSLSNSMVPQGFVTAAPELLNVLESRSGSYVQSSTLPLSTTAAAYKALQICNSEEGDKIRKAIKAQAAKFRRRMKSAGFEVLGEDDMPVCPVVFRGAQPDFVLKFAKELLHNEGILALAVTSSYIPLDSPRILVSVSAAHTDEHIDTCVDAFIRVGERLGISFI